MSQTRTVAEIQNLPIPELAEALPGLSVEDLTALRALEAQETRRAGALKAIDAALAAGAPPAAEPSEAAPATALAWQQPDYAGPLDIEQMDWRRRNIKPVRAVETK